MAKFDAQLWQFWKSAHDTVNEPSFYTDMFDF